MTEAYGLEVGAYGFLVNVMREFLTVLFMPILMTGAVLTFVVPFLLPLMAAVR